MATPAQPLSAADLIKQKLAQMLQLGKTPNAATPRGTPPFVKPGMAPQQTPTDQTPDANPPPTIQQQVTPQDGPQKQPPPATGTPATPKASPMPDAEWAKNNPGAAPAPPTPFTEPSGKEKLKNYLLYGLGGLFDREKGVTGAALDYKKNLDAQRQAATTAQQNYPQTLHAARTAAENTDLSQKHTAADTANLESETAYRGDQQHAPVKYTMDEQLAKAIGENDAATVNRILDVQARQAGAKQDPGELQLANWKLELYKTNPKAFDAMYGEHGARPETPGEFQYHLYKTDRPAFDAIFGGKDRAAEGQQLKFLQQERDKVSAEYDKRMGDVLTTPQEKAQLTADKAARLKNYDDQIATLRAGQPQPTAAPGAPAHAAADPLGIR